jgi:glyoxalase family protein
MTTPSVAGIHHVTCVAGDPQENVDFYAGTLGLRLVKRSVNQDDVETYHLFYADAEGRPGTDITFFPWSRTRDGQVGTGMATEVAFAVPGGSLTYWRDRLEGAGVDLEEAPDRFGDPALTFRDPDGLPLALVAPEDAAARRFTTWDRSPVPAEHQLRGFHGVRVLQRELEPTAAVATDVLGLEHVGTDDGWDRYEGTDPRSGYLDLRAEAEARRGQGGAGTVHHVAWRAGDGDAQKRFRQAVLDHGLRPTQVIDRHWFESVYFREPGGVLLELATEEPGFSIDEPLESLGESLVLPPWLESERDRIESALPELTLPYPTADAETDAT